MCLSNFCHNLGFFTITFIHVHTDIEELAMIFFPAVPVLDYVTFTIQVLDYNYDRLLRDPYSNIYVTVTSNIIRQVSVCIVKSEFLFWFLTLSGVLIFFAVQVANYLSCEFDISCWEVNIVTINSVIKEDFKNKSLNNVKLKKISCLPKILLTHACMHAHNAATNLWQ